MKKMLITAIAAFAVIAAIVGCQVYDSQTNENLYHAGQKLEDFANDFIDASQAFYDNSADEAAYNQIVDSFIVFTEFFWEKTAMAAVKYTVVSERNAELDQWAKDEKQRTGVKPTKDDASYQTKQAQLIARDNANLRSVKWCEDKYKSSCIDKALLYNALQDSTNDFTLFEFDWNDGWHEQPYVKDPSNLTDMRKFDKLTKNQKPVIDGGIWSFSAIWEKTYKLKWDYNSKK